MWFTPSLLTECTLRKQSGLAYQGNEVLDYLIGSRRTKHLVEWRPGTDDVQGKFPEWSPGCGSRGLKGSESLAPLLRWEIAHSLIFLGNYSL